MLARAAATRKITRRLTRSAVHWNGWIAQGLRGRNGRSMTTRTTTHPLATFANDKPSYADRVRHEEAAGCVTRLVEFATPPPWGVLRLDTDVRDTGPLPASLWNVYNAQGQRRIVLYLLPEAECERAVIQAWRSFSLGRVRNGLTDATSAALAEAAGTTLFGLIEAGTLEAR